MLHNVSKFNLGKGGKQERLRVQLSSSPEYMRTLTPIGCMVSLYSKSKGLWNIYHDIGDTTSSFDRRENDVLYFSPNLERGISFDEESKYFKEDYISFYSVGVSFSGKINYQNLSNGSPFLNSDSDLSFLGGNSFIKQTKKTDRGPNDIVFLYIYKSNDYIKYPLGIKVKDWRNIFSIVYKI